jgi:hypothetical protein
VAFGFVAAAMPTAVTQAHLSPLLFVPWYNCPTSITSSIAAFSSPALISPIGWHAREKLTKFA